MNFIGHALVTLLVFSLPFQVWGMIKCHIELREIERQNPWMKAADKAARERCWRDVKGTILVWRRP